MTQGQSLIELGDFVASLRAALTVVWLSQREPPVRYFYSVALGQPNVGDAPQDFCGGARAPGVGSPGGGMSGLKSVRYRYRLLPHVLAP